MDLWTDWLMTAALTVTPPNAPPTVGAAARLTAHTARHLSPAGRNDFYRWNFLEDPEETYGYVRRWRAAGLIGDREALDKTAGLYYFGGSPAWHVAAMEEWLCVCGAGLETAPHQFLLAQAYLAGGRRADGLALLAQLGTAPIDRPGPAGGGPGEVDHETAMHARWVLADHHYGRGEWSEALRWYTDAGTFGGTDIGAAWQTGRRTERIAHCRKQLGLPPE